MAGNWMDDRERQIREQEARGLFDSRSRVDEDRTWRGEGASETYGARGGDPGSERVFGERESGASYGRAGQAGYRSGSASRGWQDRGYTGVSPAMRQGEYGQGMAFERQDYRSGGRFYGDDERERVYREEYGQGGVEYGEVPAGYDAGDYGARRARHPRPPALGGSSSEPRPGEYRRDLGRPLSGGTGGYDYERGYGDAARRESRGDRFEDAGRGAGQFLHRAGERVAAWFGAGSEAHIYDPEFQNGRPRGARGLGPQGYKRSDERISDDAHEHLTDDTWLDATDISISVSGGEVTLSGTVESRQAKHRAEHLVENLSGVTHVQNNLRVSKGSFLTSAGPGYGDSVLGAQLRAADDAVANGTGGAGGGQSTAGKKN